MASDSPAVDVLLYGPTGVTGREVARYLHDRAPRLGLRWGVAGRDRDRMAATLATVGAAPDAIVLADSSDPASIDAMVSQARVVANLVGPYARYAEPVYAACARTGTHQLDLTGETDWVAAMIARFDDEATESGARMVPTSGFEALPFDLGTLAAAHRLHERTGDPVVGVDIAVSMSSDVPLRAASDAVSGGTFTSGVDAVRRGMNPSFTDPYVLDTPGSTASGTYDLRPRKHHPTGAWLSPMFPTAFLNPPVVHRSASLLRDSEDPIFSAGFRYTEGAVTAALGPAPLAAPTAVTVSVATAAMRGLARLPERLRSPAAGLLERVGPKSGDGPRPEDLDRWTYRLDIRATDASGATEDYVVEADGHPGYRSTATMIGEAALALADPEAGVPDGAGFLTPATALGLASLPRFRHAGVRFGT